MTSFKTKNPIIYLCFYQQREVYKRGRLTDKCSAVAEMGDRLATIDTGQKLGAVPRLRRTGLLTAYALESRVGWTPTRKERTNERSPF